MTSAPTQETDIGSRFARALKTEASSFAPDWMLSWDFAQKVKKLTYYDQYHGIADLYDWMRGAKKVDRLGYFPDEIQQPIIELSRAFDLGLLRQYGFELPLFDYDKFVGRNNAHDFLYQNLYPIPERYGIRRIFDFGAGYGRQANLWHQKRPDLCYVAMDSIMMCYCLQYEYLRHMMQPLHEYLDDLQNFRIRDETGLFHLPTWRHDLLPDDFFDLAICVMVLPELEERMVHFIIETMQRILRVGGALYIRDHGKRVKSAHQMDLEPLLIDSGFVLEFRPHVLDMKDITGIPRVWRKADAAITLP